MGKFRRSSAKPFPKRVILKESDYLAEAPSLDTVTSESEDSKPSWISGYLLSFCIFFLVSTFNLYEYLLRVSPSVMTHEIMVSYQINATAFGNLSAFFYFIYAPMQIGVGILMDRYGPAHLLPCSVFICAIGALLFAATPYLLLGQMGRLLIGFGSAFAFVGGLKVFMMRFPTRYFGFLTGLLVSFCQLGGILGQVFLAFLMNRMKWQPLYYGIALVGFILSFFMFLWLFDWRRKRITPRLSGHWLPVFLGLRRILKNPRVWLIAFIGCLFYLPTSVFAELWGVSFLKANYGLTNFKAAYAVSMIFLGWATGSPVVGWISDCYVKKIRTLMMLGASCSFVLLSTLLLHPQVLKEHLNFFMFILGFAGSSQMLVITLMRKSVPLKVVSTGIAFLNMFVLLGGFLIQPLVGFLLDSFWQGKIINGLKFYSGGNYQISLMILPLALLLGVLLSGLLAKTPVK